MMDKVMAFLMKNITAFMAWWAKLTGTSQKRHFGIGFNWPAISFVVALWIVLLVIGFLRWVF